MAAEPPRASEGAPPPPTVGPATNPDYVLAINDTITVTVLGEPELNATELIDNDGVTRLPLIGSIRLANLSVRIAENVIAVAYREKEFLRFPEVRIHVVAHASRFATIFGAVRSPGKILFPRDSLQMEILDLISQGGGLTPMAKPDAVTVSRTLPDGTETITTVNVTSLMSRRRRDEKSQNFIVRPGDRIFVPERLF